MEIRQSRQVVHSSAYHVVWCTKYRRKVIEGQIEADFKNVIRELAEEKDVVIMEMEVMPDHVHLLVDVHPQYGIGEFIKNAKGRTARYLRANHPSLKTRLPNLWTHSYFVATVGGAPLDKIKEYIATQKDRP